MLNTIWYVPALTEKAKTTYCDTEFMEIPTSAVVTQRLKNTICHIRIDEPATKYCKVLRIYCSSIKAWNYLSLEFHR